MKLGRAFNLMQCVKRMLKEERGDPQPATGKKHCFTSKAQQWGLSTHMQLTPISI